MQAYHEDKNVDALAVSWIQGYMAGSNMYAITSGAANYYNVTNYGPEDLSFLIRRYCQQDPNVTVSYSAGAIMQTMPLVPVPPELKRAVQGR
jgi:hypothetical protein